MSFAVPITSSWPMLLCVGVCKSVCAWSCIVSPWIFVGCQGCAALSCYIRFIVRSLDGPHFVSFFKNWAVIDETQYKLQLMLLLFFYVHSLYCKIIISDCPYMHSNITPLALTSVFCMSLGYQVEVCTLPIRLHVSWQWWIRSQVFVYLDLVLLSYCVTQHGPQTDSQHHLSGDNG